MEANAELTQTRDLRPVVPVGEEAGDALGDGRSHALHGFELLG